MGLREQTGASTANRLFPRHHRSAPAVPPHPVPGKGRRRAHDSFPKNPALIYAFSSTANCIIGPEHRSRDQKLTNEPNFRRLGLHDHDSKPTADLHRSAPAIPRHPVLGKGRSLRHARFKTNPRLIHSLSPAANSIAGPEHRTRPGQKLTNEPDLNFPPPLPPTPNPNLRSHPESLIMIRFPLRIRKGPRCPAR